MSLYDFFGGFRRVVVGKELKSSSASEHKLSKLAALAMLSSDALSSVAYGTEQIVVVLMVAGAVAIWFSIPIAVCVLILLFSLVLSYRQIIRAYPGGGGAYRVSSENLGTGAGLVSGGALLVDYMLTVAVSVAAGAEAIISAFPVLEHHQVAISIFIIILITVLNLRGVRESAGFLIVPVYLFVVITFCMICFGFFKIATGQVPFHATAAVGTAIPAVGVALLLKSFSSGSASLTGVEAISNAVPFFKEPRAKNAAKTLTIMGLILGFFFFGITFLNYWYGIVPEEKMTVLAQVNREIFGGKNILFYIMQFATAMILAVAANTGFSAFPMLSFNLAKDKFMPHMFKERGARLGYSNGIITLAAGAAILVVMFHGKVESLIPLYSIGVFVPFTLSQSGMVVHWYRQNRRNFLLRSIPNIVGAIISATIVVIMIVFRLPHIWPFFVIMPIIIAIFLKIKKHYQNVAEQLRLREPKPSHIYAGNTVIVLIGNVTNVDLGAINYARSIGDYIVALHVDNSENPEKDAEVREEFSENFPDIRYVRVPATTSRSIIKPIVKSVKRISETSHKYNHTTTVLVPQFIPNKPWKRVLHNQSAVRIKYVLANYEDVIISSYNYHLKR
ncbi:MAG: APC family permease [Lactobacillales bacterium]|jgi:amino acid transporter|nr:APC family permease [Lactobacillales bacterium]